MAQKRNRKAEALRHYKKTEAEEAERCATFNADCGEVKGVESQQRDARRLAAWTRQAIRRGAPADILVKGNWSHQFAWTAVKGLTGSQRYRVTGKGQSLGMALSLALLGVREAVRTFDPAKGSFRSHCISRARYALLRAIQEQSREVKRDWRAGDELDESGEPYLDDDDWGSRGMTERELKKGRRAVALLLTDDADRRLLRLRFESRLTLEAIAGRLGTTRSTISRRLTRMLLRASKALLAEWCPEAEAIIFQPKYGRVAVKEARGVKEP